MDDYQLYMKRKVQALGIYMSLANLKFLLGEPEDSIIRIAIIPQSVDLDNVVKHIIVYPMLDLEKGVEMEVNGVKRHFIGSLFCILGDHKGMVEVGGFTGTGSNKPCRFSKGDKRTQAKVDPPYSKIRDPMEVLSYLMASKNPDHTLYKHKPLLEKLMAQAGIVSFSPLWSLGWYRQHFFVRMGLCYLHNELHGNIERHTLYLGEKKGKTFRDQVNEIVANFPKCPGFEETGKTIYEITNNSQLRKPVLSLGLFSGAQINWWFQMSPIVMRQLNKKKLANGDKVLTDQELKLWMDHVKMDKLLCQTKHDEKSLNELWESIQKFRKDFVQQLADRPFATQENRTEGGNNGEEEEIICVKCKTGLLNGDKFCSKCGQRVLNQTNNSLLKAGRSPYYMKFESLLHWIRLIKFLGPVWFMNTPRFEYFHQVCFS